MAITPELKPKDVVVVTSRGIYRGMVGTIVSITESGLSARVELRTWMRPTLRLSSLRLADKHRAPAPAAVSDDRTARITKLLSALSDEDLPELLRAISVRMESVDPPPAPRRRAPDR